MVNDVQFKVCGLRSAPDAIAASDAGAAYLGFILYPKSPRYISIAQYRDLKPALPERSQVAVMVIPSDGELEEAKAAGFSFFQIHYPADIEVSRVREWSGIVGRKALWLAPKMPPGATFNDEWLDLADSILWDAYKKDAFGGTGAISDWDQFKLLQSANSQTRWILAGGLGPENLRQCLLASGATIVDLNSGVEESPGVKDHDKIAQVKTLLNAL